MTRRKHGFAAKDRSSQCRVEAWRRENRMMILRGMPFSTLPEEFEAACHARLSQHQSLQFEWEPSCNPWLIHRGRVALGFENAEMRAEAERRLEGWYWKAHPIKQVTKTLPPAAKTVDLTASSPRAPARSLVFRLLTPVNVPCAAATAVQEASCIATEAAAAADAAVAEAHAATFRAFTAEAAGDVAAAASAQEEASAADERARSAYGAAASAARIASAYSSCISSRDDFYRY
ncbi:hypothetical protein MY8738_009796 [Beauveria namnaoensis]